MPLPQPRLLLPKQRSWSSLAGSAVVHAIVIALALLASQGPLEEDEEKPERPRTDPSRQVEMVYLPPPTPQAPPPAPPPPPPPPAAQPEPPRPTPQPSAPPPETRQPEPVDRANAPPEEVRSEGEETDEPEGASDPAAPADAPRAEAPTMESEALRIFGRRRIATRPGAGPRAVRPMETYIPDRPEKCVPRPAAPADSAAPAQFGTVVGRIFREDGGRPLAGAHLQMLGTPYTAFTDSEGEYEFKFDLSLMDNCRTQYVRVTARGYESRLLVLVVGQNVRSEDVRLQRRSGWPGL